MPQWQPCTWVPGHYTSPSHYVDPSQTDSINVSSIRDLEGPMLNSIGFLYNELYHPSSRSIFSSHLVHPSAVSHNADSLLSSCTDSIVDPDTAVCHTNGVDYLAINGQSAAENLLTGLKALTERTEHCYHPCDSHILLANDPAQNVVPTATSQSDTTMTISTQSALLPQVSLSSVTTAENTSVVVSNGNMREIFTSAYCVDTICPQACPPGYQRRCFPFDMAEKIIRVYGIPTHNVYYYRRDRDSDDHLCPLGCGRRFIGKSIKAHLENFHPNINSHSRKEICCRTQSHPKSKCPPKNVVQGRYFVKHFTAMHSLAHSLCPFCWGRQTRFDHLHRHFAVCRILRPKGPSQLE
ncbi:hypothetical protein ARMSODRAFT_767395 [Armillaria solidipes]|uniref:Uncharacterized protein n=1 Tax=Armillaria solidipes TaxID=1076256 RepID=A0A2H3AM07_9AGAR|nr:hypothetical protein ARMSODRAFT_767395 [Armillaria solidipes]